IAASCSRLSSAHWIPRGFAPRPGARITRSGATTRSTGTSLEQHPDSELQGAEAVAVGTWRPAIMDDEGLAEARAANPFHLPDVTQELAADDSADASTPGRQGRLLDFHSCRRLTSRRPTP